MKKLIALLMVFFLTMSVYSQISVRTVKSYHEVDQIFGEVLSGVEYSDAFSLRGREGIMTLFFDLDTTGTAAASANKSDSCYTIGFQVYVDPIGWCTYYNDRTTHKTISFTKIDTIARSLQTSENLFMNVATATTADAIGDSMRFVHFIGTGDSIDVVLELRQE